MAQGSHGRGTSKTTYLARFEPRNRSQTLARELLSRGARVLFLLGPPGTGKTHAAMGLALELLEQGKVGRVCLTRPCIQAAGEELGFLKGTLEQKVEPYLEPFRHVRDKLVYSSPSSSQGNNRLDRLFDVRPLAFLRGVTFENTAALLDEAQNCTYAQLKLYLSRLGKGSVLILSGDPDQPDVRPALDHRYHTDLEFVAACLESHLLVGVVHFVESETLRDPELAGLLARLP